MPGVSERTAAADHLAELAPLRQRERLPVGGHAEDDEQPWQIMKLYGLSRRSDYLIERFCAHGGSDAEFGATGERAGAERGVAGRMKVSGRAVPPGLRLQVRTPRGRPLGHHRVPVLDDHRPPAARLPPGTDPVAVVLRQPAIPIRDRLATVPAALADVIDTVLDETDRTGVRGELAAALHL